MDAEITDDGPKITDVRLPDTPYSGIEKLSFEDFSQTDFMQRIARDVNKDNWPQWVATLLHETDHFQVYPMVIKEQFYSTKIFYPHKKTYILSMN